MRAVISILLSVIILLSSSGLTYAAHYCGSFRMHTTLSLGKAELSCGMAMAMPACEDGEEDHDCCDDEFQDLLTDDHFNKSQWELNLDHLVWISHSIISFEGLSFDSEDSEAGIPYYRPPPPRLKQYQLYETYLI